MRRYLPSLAALQAFEAAARFLNFTKAADDLGLTQSGISRQIHNLEKFLGVALFHRSGPRLVLTDVGANYYRDLSLTLDRLQEITIDAVRGRTVDSSLMIGSHPTLGARWLPRHIGGFIRVYPDLPVEVTLAPADIDFETTRLDVAILRGVGTWLNARSLPLFAEEIALVASPKLVPLGKAIDRQDFANYPLLQNASRPSLWLHWLRLSGLQHQGRIQGTRFAHTEMLINAAVQGIGIAIVPVCYIELELARQELHLPFGPPILSGDSYYAVYPERKAQLPSVLAFRDWIAHEARSYRKPKSA